MQQERINKVKKDCHYKEALKKATLEYYEESKKICDDGKCVGKSSDKIAKEVKLRHDGVGPDARTIR